MAFKNDPGMLLVNAWLPRSDADELVRLANSRGISRSELLRRVARELIEDYEENKSNE
jgi:metal-responsive CopG/Arc/MetJ family transcriptional regulator